MFFLKKKKSSVPHIAPQPTLTELMNTFFKKCFQYTHRAMITELRQAQNLYLSFKASLPGRSLVV